MLMRAQISGPGSEACTIVQDGNRQMVRDGSGRVMSTFISGGDGSRGGVSMSSISSSGGGSGFAGTSVGGSGFVGTSVGGSGFVGTSVGGGFGFNPAAAAVSRMMAQMGAGGGALAMAAA